ncbi:MAG TPA: hypothetical protein VLY46_02725 [Usitatibacter sp.]|nr:hypothetical protein [Usitatibacter sp.]
MRALSRVVSTVLLAAVVASGGCGYYEPYPSPYGVASTYDRSWNAALGALRDQGRSTPSACRARRSSSSRSRGGTCVRPV